MQADWTRNLVWATLILIVGCGGAYLLLVSKPGPVPEALPQPKPPSVDVVLAEPRRHSLLVKTQGSVRPLREIELVAQVGGRVEEVSPQFAEGGFFRKGEQLLKIEDVDYRFDIARAESQVAAARQRVAEEQGRAQQARREWRDLGSKQANALFLREPQLASAEAALGAAKADLQAAELDLARTSVQAPFNGRISAKHVDMGQFVGPGASLATVYDTDVAQVRLPLTDKQVALLDLPLSYDNTPQQNQDRGEVLLRARFGGQDWTWPGRIVRTDASIDLDSRVVYALAVVDKPFRREAGSERPPLSPGLFVHAEIKGRQLEQVSVLPRSALRSDGRVMLVDSDQRLQMREVQVLQSTSREVWLRGLQAGERVVVKESGVTVAGMQVLVNIPGDLAGAEH